MTRTSYSILTLVLPLLRCVICDTSLILLHSIFIHIPICTYILSNLAGIMANFEYAKTMTILQLVLSDINVVPRFLCAQCKTAFIYLIIHRNRLQSFLIRSKCLKIMEKNVKAFQNHHQKCSHPTWHLVCVEPSFL